ncbi:cytochrome c peroxidase [Wenyingzhuangia heitensis]|uniref:Cytochrome c peroxidase n=1 Tax=Wenyingzhuangia heitensis TaxID=1487859 RepID=A0ABX0UDE9_9FLAO|nr:cytochrome c peroxidase [Wenyingzhuangia heitensis]NIJ45561.1 cytochrome c peroxidase [Wenyingzhuangia heitensis]
MKYNTILFVFLLVMVSCGQDEEEVYTDFEISFEQPANFPATTYDFEDNPITTDGFILGRKLFYDNRLSLNNGISCAECHNQSHAFTHHGHDLSEGVHAGVVGTRNSQPIQNLAFLEDFTWDGAKEMLFDQPLIPITEEVEMDETMENVIAKLKEDSVYQELFTAVFQSEDAINSVNLLNALSQFMGAMVSSNSKYDKYVRGEVGGSFTDLEKEGLALFQQKCANCHSGELFTNQEFINNGIGENSSLPDETGRARINSPNPFATVEELKTRDDYYQFRVPSLRNVIKTYPYMHDGRFVMLSKVLDFYDDDTYPLITKMDNLDSRLIQTNSNGEEILGIPMTEGEKVAILAFLETLTDNEFINDERFAKPN